MIKKTLLLAAIVSLTGCAYSDGQRLDVITKLPGAICDLSNDKGSWRVVTPARVRVRESAQPMNIRCERNGETVSFEVPAKTPSTWQRLMYGTTAYADKEMVVKKEPTK